METINIYAMLGSMMILCLSVASLLHMVLVITRINSKEG